MAANGPKGLPGLTPTRGCEGDICHIPVSLVFLLHSCKSQSLRKVGLKVGWLSPFSFFFDQKVDFFFELYYIYQEREKNEQKQVREQKEKS